MQIIELIYKKRACRQLLAGSRGVNVVIYLREDRSRTLIN
jgi:hypothetical protein